MSSTQHPMECRWRAAVTGARRYALWCVIGVAAVAAGARDAQARFQLYEPSDITAQAEKDLKSGTGTIGQLGRDAVPMAVPDRFGPGAVLGVGSIRMKVVNYGSLGNPFTNTSSDPSAQWPGSSGVEYLNLAAFMVGAVNPSATDPNALRRVSYFTEWRPPTVDAVDRIYRAFDGIINGARFVNDDGDQDHTDPTTPPLIDEDFLDGRDNDGDGLIDEDHGAVGQQEFSFVIRDDTREAINSPANEKHVPIGLQANVRAWAYSIQGFQDFNVCEYEIENVSGHELDSVFVGWLLDMDAGPIQLGNYWADDIDFPTYPQGEFQYRVGGVPGDLPDPLRKQTDHDPSLNGDFPPDSSLCPRVTLRVNGFSVADLDGDNGRTPGMGTFMLVNHSTDPTGTNGPARVGFRAFRSFTGGTAYTAGGNARIDQERFEFLSSTDNIDPETGFVSKLQGDARGDYQQLCSLGPWRHFLPGKKITATVAFGVRQGSASLIDGYANDYHAYHPEAGVFNYDQLPDLISGTRYQSLQNALTVQVAYEGVHETREGYPETNADDGRDFHGRETPIKLTRGSPPATVQEDCSSAGREARDVIVSDRNYSWFDFDCDYCTGVWDFNTRRGLFHKTWNAAAPPPNPNTNASSQYNFTDNPDRAQVPSGDRLVNLAWDNISEVTPDPKSRWVDFRGFQIWKVADWIRPVGSAGPSEADWALVGEFRAFDYFTSIQATGVAIERNYTRDTQGVKHCPKVFIPNAINPQTHQMGDSVEICLDRFDLWNKQSGQIIVPDWKTPCEIDTTGALIPLVINTGDIVFDGGSAQVSFPNEGSYPFLCLRHPAQTGSVNVVAGAADSAVIQMTDGSPTGFSPATVTIRPGGHVRFANTGQANHAIQSDRDCKTPRGVIVHRQNRDLPSNQELRVRYPIGRYRFVDRDVKNGFSYFYSVAAFDSTTDNSITTELAGRRSGVEAEAVVPEVSVNAHGEQGVWVVPNPYRGNAQISQRPSSWDLTPNATDPTGTHIDFLGMPSGPWTIRIYTVSGDLVQELKSSDAVNQSVRQPVKVSTGETLPGFNRQQDNANDGQARWNLISRNGQDIVSGIYVFTVDSSQGIQRGKFVVIR